MSTRVTAVGKKWCNYKNYLTNYRKDITDRSFCTFARTSKACAGDSGGPAVKINYNTNQYVLFGILSATRSCKIYDEPTICTSVNQFIPWIVHIVKGYPNNVTDNERQDRVYILN